MPPAPDDLIVHCSIIQICSTVLHHIVCDSFLNTLFSKQVRPQRATVTRSKFTAKHYPITRTYIHTHTHTHTGSCFLNGLKWRRSEMGVSAFVKDWFPADTKIINRPLTELLTITPTLYADAPFILMARNVPLNIQLRARTLYNILFASKMHVC